MKVIDTISWDGKLIKRVVISNESKSLDQLVKFYASQFEKGIK